MTSYHERAVKSQGRSDAVKVGAKNFKNYILRYTFHTLGSRQISKVTLEMRPLVEYSTLLEFLLQQAIAVFQKHQRENTA